MKDKKTEMYKETVMKLKNLDNSSMHIVKTLVDGLSTKERLDRENPDGKFLKTG